LTRYQAQGDLKGNEKNKEKAAIILNMLSANHMITKAIYFILFKFLEKRKKKRVQIYSTQS